MTDIYYIVLIEPKQEEIRVLKAELELMIVKYNKLHKKCKNSCDSKER